MCKIGSLAFLLLFSLATVSPGQTNIIGVYDDQFGTDCTIDDGFPGLIVVHVVHTSSAGAVMCRFRAPAPDCFTGVWLSDAAVFGNTTGDSQTGVEIGYGSCESGALLVLSINYFGQGTTPDCCQYPVIPYWTTLPGAIEVVDCALNTVAGVGYTSLINDNASCDCCLPGTINVPPYPSIQAAVDAACAGDTIVLADGTYTGTGNRDININKPITIRSASGDPALCVIDCQGSEADPRDGLVVGLDAGAIHVEGITIRGALGPGAYGVSFGPFGGIRIMLSMKDCRLTDNRMGVIASFCDGFFVNCELDNNETQGLHLQYDGNIVVDSCVFWNNGRGIFTQERTLLSISNSSITNNETGIEVEEGGTLVVDNCEIVGNDFAGLRLAVDQNTITNSRITSNGWGIWVCGLGPADISGSVIAHNADGALWAGCSSQYVSFQDCTMYGNSGTLIDAGGTPGFTYVGFADCIIAFNTTTLTIDSPDSLHVECTDIYGNDSGDWAGTGFSTFQGINGNISEDPEFCDAPNDNFYLSHISPCLAACGTMGPYGIACASPYPAFLSVEDVPGDQGGWVTLTWVKSKFDDPNVAEPVTDYWVYRRRDSASRLEQFNPGASIERSGKTHDARFNGSAAHPPPTVWDHVGTIPAVHDSIYQWAAPTVCDSTINLGLCYTAYYISARLDGGSGYYDSVAKRGYSVDNLAPGPPVNVTAAYNTGGGNYLTWDRPGDPDVAYCGVYRDDELIAYATADEWLDTEYNGWTVTYEISAVDTSGNEGPKAGPDQTTAIEPKRMPTRFALHQNKPNPFNPATVIHYDVPSRGGHVTIKIYDVTGRLVRTLVDSKQTRGEQTVTWHGRDDQGSRVATGVYFYKMTAPGYAVTRKMVMVQ